MHVAKLVYNENQWTIPSNLSNLGVILNNGDYYGYEEWLKNEFLKKNKLGYVECFRKCRRVGNFDRIALITFDRRTRTIYYVGNLYDVKQLTNNEIAETRNMLIQQNWQQNRNIELNQIFPNTDATMHYTNCFNSNEIIGDYAESFILNIRYEKIELHPKDKWVNLTNINIKVNNWKRLSVLNFVYTEMLPLFTKK